MLREAIFTTPTGRKPPPRVADDCWYQRRMSCSTFADSCSCSLAEAPYRHAAIARNAGIWPRVTAPRSYSVGQPSSSASSGPVAGRARIRGLRTALATPMAGGAVPSRMSRFHCRLREQPIESRCHSTRPDRTKGSREGTRQHSVRQSRVWRRSGLLLLPKQPGAWLQLPLASGRRALHRVDGRAQMPRRSVARSFQERSGECSAHNGFHPQVLRHRQPVPARCRP